LITFAISGMLLYTNALRQGQVGPVTAVLWIGEVVAPSAVGLALLGDTVMPGWELAAAAAGLATIGAAVVLGTAPASAATAQADEADVPAAAAPAAPARTTPARRAGKARTVGKARTAAPVAAIQAARAPMWPSYAWPEPSRNVPVEALSYADEVAPIRWWGPPHTDRQAGTYWWWGPGRSPQLIWVPPERTSQEPVQPVWWQPSQPERFAA
jgi:hypothetical protein